MKRWVAGVVFTVASHGALSAQTQAESEKKPLPLNELVVSVTRTDRTVREVPANVTVLTRDQIRLSAAQTVSDLLRSIPGFTMRDYQSSTAVIPARQAPAMRGLGGTSAGRTLVLVDGVPLDDPFSGWVYWSRIPLDLVDRIEIVRGGSAGVWGNRALGGVINIITQRPATDAASFSLQGGDWATSRANGTLMRRTGRLGVAVAGEWFGTDGFYVVPAADRGTIDIRAGTKHKVAFGRLEYQALPNLAVQISGNWFDEYRRNATQLKRIGTDIGQLQAGAHLTTGDGSQWSASTFAARKRGYLRSSTEADDRLTETLSVDQFALPANSLGGNVQWSRGLGTRHDVTAGADLFWTEGELHEDTRPIADVLTRRRSNSGKQLYRGVYVQDMFEPGARWHLLLGGRIDFWRNYEGTRSERDLANGEMLVDTAYAAQTESQFSYHVGVRFDATDRLSVRSSVHTAFRAPTLNELYRAARESGNVTLEANPELSAERVLGAEVGVDYVLGSRGTARLTAFRNQLTNPIVDVTIGMATGGTTNIPPCGTTTSGGTCRQRQNLGESRSHGLEAELELRPVANVRLTGLYGWNPTEVTEAPGQPHTLGKRARSVAEHSATLRAAYTNTSLGVAEFSARWVGHRFEDDVNTIDLDPFFVLDARLTRTVNGHWEVFGAVENLLGEEYMVSRAPNGKVRTGAPRFLQAGVRARW